MNSWEKGSRIDPESYVADVLAGRPPLPVDNCELSGLWSDRETTASEPGYAWERLPRWLAEIEAVYDSVADGPILCVDVCSSLPLYAQLLRAGAFDRAGERAREVGRSFFNEDSLGKLIGEYSALRPVALALGRDKESRMLLEAAIQEMMYGLTVEEARSTDGQAYDLFREGIQAKLAGQKYTYTQPRGSHDIEAAWRLRFDSAWHPHSYFELLCELPVPTEAALAARRRLAAAETAEEQSEDQILRDRQLTHQVQPAGAELAGDYLRWQTNVITNLLIDNRRFRPARFFSLDNARPEEIAASSLANTPLTTRSLHLFSHAMNSLLDPRRHLTHDLAEELPFPDNSLALVTCFDAWPFHCRPERQSHEAYKQFAQDTLMKLENIYQKLAYGGKMVIFPWGIAGASAQEKQLLDEVTAEFARSIYHGVDKRGFHRETLLGWMSDSDHTTAETLSPIFQANNSYLEALIITKPRASLAKHYRKVAGQLAVSSLQAPAPPDPRP